MRIYSHNNQIEKIIRTNSNLPRGGGRGGAGRELPTNKGPPGGGPVEPGTARDQVIGVSTISTRRFWARPSGVALLAMGLFIPMPRVMMRAGSTFWLSR